MCFLLQAQLFIHLRSSLSLLAPDKCKTETLKHNMQAYFSVTSGRLVSTATLVSYMFLSPLAVSGVTAESSEPQTQGKDPPTMSIYSC